MPEDAPKKSKPIEVYAEAEPVKLGSMLLTLVEPTHGHEVAYNRWYERDHFYAGCMVGPYNFAGRRYVATADLKALRDPDPSAITGAPPRGSYISAYWVLDGYHDVWNKWALRQVNALHAAGRMFQEREHVHTLLYFFEWEHRREPDGVPVELALDHPYRGFVTVFIDRDESITNEDLWSWLRNEHLPGLMPGTDADLVAAFTPIALEVDAPGDVPREAARDNRTVLLWFLNTPPEVAWEPVIAEHRRRLEEAGKGRVVAALPFIPTIPGTDTYTDKLWADSARPRAAAVASVPGQDLDVGDDEDGVVGRGPTGEGRRDGLELVGVAHRVLERLGGEARVAHPVGPQRTPPGPCLGIGVRPR